MQRALQRPQKSRPSKQNLQTPGLKPFPEGPKIEKIQDFAPGLKLSSDQSQIETLNREWNFQARLKITVLLWGIVKVGIEIFKRDWNFQSRLKLSILDWNFQAYGLKISCDQSGLNFFNRRALWVGFRNLASRRRRDFENAFIFCYFFGDFVVILLRILQ